MTDSLILDLFRIDLRDKKIIVVGGGPVAVKRVRRLLSFGAIVKIIAKEITEEMGELAQNSRVSLEKREVSKEDIEDAYLVIAATDNREVNHSVQSWAKQKGILCNRADIATEGDVHFSAPLTPEESPFKISMLSGEAGPVFSHWVKRRFFGEKEITEMEKVWHLLKTGRQFLDEMRVHGRRRKQLLESLMESVEQKKSHPEFYMDRDEIRKFLEDLLQKSHS